jgi:hypothetical protein
MRVSSKPYLGLGAPLGAPDSPGAPGAVDDTRDLGALREGGNFTPPRTGMCGSGVAGQTIFGIPHQSPARIASAMANLTRSHNNSFHCSGGCCGASALSVAGLGGPASRYHHNMAAIKLLI